jgi:F-box and leucine-rich repeat protein 2/20
LNALANFCPGIEVLNLHSCDVSSPIPSNHTLNVDFPSQTITDTSIRNVAMNCTNMRQLCVSKCGELTDSTLVALANYNPHLSTLEVAGCHQFTDIGFQALGKVSWFEGDVWRGNEWIWRSAAKSLT